MKLILEGQVKSRGLSQVLSVHALIDFTINFCCCQVDEKIKLKVLAYFFEILTSLKIHPITRFKDPKAAILTLKMLPESHL
jgi:hypothetical protein